MRLYLLFLLAVAAANASIVISETGPVSVGYALYADEAITTSWSSLNGYNNVSIFATLSNGLNNSDVANSGVAYLTDSVGPGTNSASEIAVASFTFPSLPTQVQLFSGVNLLPGTYYLTLFSDTSQGGGWDATDTPGAVTLGDGVVKDNGLYSNALTGGPNASFAPNSSFSSPASDLVYQPLYQVAGDIVTVSEPPFTAMLSIVMLAFLLVRADRSLKKSREAGELKSLLKLSSMWA